MLYYSFENVFVFIIVLFFCGINWEFEVIKLEIKFMFFNFWVFFILVYSFLIYNRSLNYLRVVDIEVY